LLRDLFKIFSDRDPLSEVSDDFAKMLDLTQNMTHLAGQIFFGEEEKSARDQVLRLDIQVNELERVIRRALLVHLAVPGNSVDVPYSLLLMSLVKDVERLGDYAKNLAEIVDIRPEPHPEGQVLSELMAIRQSVAVAYQSCAKVVTSAQRKEATELIRRGRETARRCDQLITGIGSSDYDAATTTAFILGTRYYKRINAHVLNVLSSVVMPLDKVDYYDEKESP